MTALVPDRDSKTPLNKGAQVRRCLMVDPHPVFRHGMRQLISRLPDVEVCAEAENAASALDAMRRCKPDVALIEVSMPGTNGIELLKRMLAEEPHLLVLVISVHDEALYALRALRAGAKGYLMKHQAMEAVFDALRKVLDGGIYVSPQLSERLVFRAIHGCDGDIASPVDKLSDRELEVLQLFGRGESTRSIAEMLHLSVKTIETHRAHIKEKLGFKDAEEMVKFATEWIAASE
jgi:DNA-binding NarL/FixJ family response regulator